MHRITKAALAAATLPVAALLLAPPASAHGTTQHTVGMAGTVDITDVGPLGGLTHCIRTIPSRDDTAQLPLDPQVVFSPVALTCNDVRVTVAAQGTLASTGVVTISGTVVVEDRDCFVVCTTDPIGSRSFTRTLNPASSISVTGSVNDFAGANQGGATWNLAFANSF